MQGLDLEMLVDHYPLRHAVRAGSGQNSDLHSMKLLAEAMAGSEVLLLVSGEGSGSDLKPLVFKLEGKNFFVAGTMLEYAQSGFVQYLASNVVDKPMLMHQMDARRLVLLAAGLGNIHGILFDLEIEGEDDAAFAAAMVDSELVISDLARQAVTDVNELMEAGPDGGYGTVPAPVLSLLARERDPDERRKTLSGYLSHRTRGELEKMVVFMSTDEEKRGDAFTTLARGIHERTRLFHESGEDFREHGFVPVTVYEWLNGLAHSGSKRVTLDTHTVISGRFARAVLGIDGSTLPGS